MPASPSRPGTSSADSAPFPAERLASFSDTERHYAYAILEASFPVTGSYRDGLDALYKTLTA
ncbi:MULTISPECIES: hypothetical protein [Amycolatopsis]|uniref:Uncharacterized protein n=1 Tax=Amycolatopsis dendrobii TaxID=2760662 RepID=A0A7W3W6U3_9PSEU|nr:MULTISPECIES: hypothetical protein [Amycolatopsis]MBB1159876.1 hypothetical protein [Amycolatopsis dendrobii]UKD59074.1 hypothetical protein L3Q65_20880 [Amycolatopsis sp. FU40]